MLARRLTFGHCRGAGEVRTEVSMVCVGFGEMGRLPHASQKHIQQ